MTILAVCLLVLGFGGDSVLIQTNTLSLVDNGVIVDTRSEAEYLAGHIPGAVHLDPTIFTENRVGIEGMLKPLNRVVQVLREKGIDPQGPVVTYSAMKHAGDLKDAARMFWILEYLNFEEVMVLDGGFSKWVSEERPVETGPEKVTPITREKLGVRARVDRIATREEVGRAVRAVGAKKEGAVLVDMRPTDFYCGEKKKDFVKRPGHIAGAVNLPVQKLLTDSQFTLKDTLELEEMLDGVKAGADTRVILYCNSGQSASVGYLVWRLIGQEKVSLYEGSLAEWSYFDDLKMRTGETP